MLNCSCDFNINNMPGPQRSFSIKEAKKHGTFICSYTVKGNKINGHHIKEILVEKKFWRSNKFLYPKEIDCCESQMSIISDEILTSEGNGFGFDWNISGFYAHNSYAMDADFKGTLFPDKFPLTVLNYKNGKRIFTLLYLTKVK